MSKEGRWCNGSWRDICERITEPRRTTTQSALVHMFLCCAISLSLSSVSFHVCYLQCLFACALLASFVLANTVFMHSPVFIIISRDVCSCCYYVSLHDLFRIVMIMEVKMLLLLIVMITSSAHANIWSRSIRARIFLRSRIYVPVCCDLNSHCHLRGHM